MKTIVILGSTGSIGTSTLDIVERFPNEFRVVGLTAGNNDEKLEEQIRRFKPPRGRAVQRIAPPPGSGSAVPVCLSKFSPARQGWSRSPRSPEAELVMSAIVGGAGLVPTLAAIRSGKQIALANKEPMVMAGKLMQDEAKRHGVTNLSRRQRAQRDFPVVLKAIVSRMSAA